MKKLFSVLALLVMALTTAFADTVTFTPSVFSGSGTTTVTATDVASGITLTIEQNFSNIQCSESSFDFGGMGDITVTATASNPIFQFKGITMTGLKNSAIATATTSGPWTFTARSGGVAPDGNIACSITIEYATGLPVNIDPIIPENPVVLTEEKSLGCPHGRHRVSGLFWQCHSCER